MTEWLLGNSNKLVANILLFWDYDTQWGGDRSRAGKGPQNWSHEFENTERLLQMQADYEMPSCIAVVGAAATPGNRPYHDPGQIRQMHQLGHEVASHTFHHDWIPGLTWDELLATLRNSKDALEQCIGAPVTCLVPPYNQPFDYPSGWSISLSERREAGRNHIGLHRLCQALIETGYRFCRVGYRPLTERLLHRLRGQYSLQPSEPETIEGVYCLRTNACGFDSNSLSLLDRCVQTGKSLVIYGHPHSLSDPQNRQRFELLEHFLQRVRELRQQGKIRCCLPRDLLAEQILAA
jgi:hypothetical protein